MPSEDVRARVEEITKKDSLLALVGAVCSSPNQVTVSATKELGLTNQEEKDAKKVAVWARENPKEVQVFFLGILKELRTRRKNVEIKKKVYNRGDLRNLLEKHFGKFGIDVGYRESGERRFVYNQLGPNQLTPVYPVYEPYEFPDSVSRLRIREFYPDGSSKDVALLIAERGNFGKGYVMSDLTIVAKESYLSSVQAFAQEYEELTGRKVVIYEADLYIT